MSSEQQPFVLPPEPPVEDSKLEALRQALRPLGVVCVMPPLATDRLKGARVALVGPGSPADRGGLKPGDLVTRINGLEIANPYAVAGALGRADPKKPTTIIATRAGKEQKIVITGLKPAAPVGGMG